MRQEILERIQDWIGKLAANYNLVNAELVGLRETDVAYYFEVKVPKSKELETKP